MYPLYLNGFNFISELNAIARFDDYATGTPHTS